MSELKLPALYDEETKLLRLVDDIASDLYGIETVLKRYQISPEEWEKIKSNPRFIQLLQSAVEAWNAASNTHERVKLKAAAAIEQWLSEAYARLHDPLQTLSAKVELGKLMAKLAGMERGNMQVEGNLGERFSVTINLGADQQIKINQPLPHKVIEHEPTGA